MSRVIKENRWRGFFMKYIENWKNQESYRSLCFQIFIIDVLRIKKLLNFCSRIIHFLFLVTGSLRYFIHHLVFLSVLVLISSSVFAQLVVDNGTGKLLPLRESFNVNGIRPVYSYEAGKVYQQYDRARDLSTLRSAMTGARATARVPAVVRRSVPALRVAARLSSKLRYAKFTPQSLIAGLILDAALQKLLEDEGYVYDEQQQDFVDGNEYVIQLWDWDENSKMRIYAQRGLSKEAVAMGEERYARVYVEEMCRNTWNNKLPGTEKYEYWNSRGYKYSHVDRFSSSCVIVKDGDTRHVINYRVVPNTKRPITDSQLQEVLVKYIENHPNPEKILEAAEMPESDWGAPKVLITQETVVNSEPYTDSRDGKAKQSLFRLWPCGGETCATETIKDRPDLKPNSPEAPAVTPGGEAGDKKGDKDKTDNQQPPPFDLCKEHPDILACQGMGDVKGNEFDDIKIPRHVNQETWKPDSFLPDNGVCPAPKTFHVLGKEFSVSYEPLCVLMEKVRFIVLIAFILMSAYVAFGGLRKG